MLPWSAPMAGRLDEHVIISDLQRDNLLGDPHERPLATHAGDALYEYCYIPEFGKAARCLRELRSLRAVWIDAGTRDEFSLDLGAQAFRAELARIGVADERVCFELFDGAHGGIDYRYPLAPGWLSERLSA